MKRFKLHSTYTYTEIEKFSETSDEILMTEHGYANSLGGRIGEHFIVLAEEEFVVSFILTGYIQADQGYKCIYSDI